MSEYYGTPIATEDFLAHYGVKGMKWGVRKAIETGNFGALSRHYRKASKKLAKLENRANKQHQQNIIKRSSNNQKIAGLLGAANIGASAGLTAMSFANAKRQAVEMAKKHGIGIGAGHVYVPVGAGIAAIDMAGNQIRKGLARKRLTVEGHRDAVREANHFRKEMKNAFRGTEYSRNFDRRANEIAKKKRDRVASGLDKYDQMVYAKNNTRSNKNSMSRQSKSVNRTNAQHKATELGLQKATRNFGLIGGAVYAAKNRDAVRAMNNAYKKRRR